MRTVKIQVYKYTELSESAKEKVKLSTNLILGKDYFKDIEETYLEHVNKANYYSNGDIFYSDGDFTEEKKGKHTGGIWEVDIAKVEEVDHKTLLVRSDNDVVCLIAPDEDIDEENKANAELIAAAPELLEALKLLVKNGFQIPSNVDMNKAKEAIKKAVE